MIRVCPTISRVRTTSSLLDTLREDFQGGGCFLNSEKFGMGLVFPAIVPFLEDKGAIMVLIMYSRVVRHLKKCGLFCRVVYRIVFRETNVTRDPSERDLGAYRVGSVNGKVMRCTRGFEV